MGGQGRKLTVTLGPDEVLVPVAVVTVPVDELADVAPADVKF